VRANLRARKLTHSCCLFAIARSYAPALDDDRDMISAFSSRKLEQGEGEKS